MRIVNGTLVSNLSAYYSKNQNMLDRIHNLDSLVGIIQGHFADMIWSIAAMEQWIKSIQKYSSGFSYNIPQHLVNINYLIAYILHYTQCSSIMNY